MTIKEVLEYNNATDLQQYILNYNWDEIFQLEHIVDSRAAYYFNDDPMGFPSEEVWPEGVDRYYAILSDGGTKVKWRDTIANLSNWNLLRKILDDLGDPSNVRLVYWFDN